MRWVDKWCEAWYNKVMINKQNNRRELESFNETVAKQFGGYAYSGWRPAIAWDNGDKTPYSKIVVNGNYGEYGNMGEPWDTIFVPSTKLEECVSYINKNKPPFVKSLEFSPIKSIKAESVVEKEEIAPRKTKSLLDTKQAIKDHADGKITS